MNQKPSSNVLQPVDLNSRTNRRYTILGSGVTGSNKERLSVGQPDQRRRASVVPKAHATPSRRVSMMPGTGTNNTAKSPGRNLNNGNNNNKSRLSTIGPGSTIRPTPGGTAGGTMQDPRPLKNKQYMDQSILRLIHYLESHDFPHKQISIENLQSPSNKDFFQIFEFVMQSIDRDFRLKEEQPLEQIPPLLKSLGYPFIIPKSYLTSAGTPHTWPLLLGALSWIRELIEFEEIASSGENLFNKHVPNKVFFDFLTKAYDLFLQGEANDEINALETELSDVVQEQKNSLEQQLIQKREHKQNLIAEIERLRKSEKRPNALNQSRATYLKDIEKYQSYMVECQNVLTIFDQQREVLLIELETRKRDLESCIESLNSYALQHATQELQQTDVDRIKLESAQITENLKQVNSKRLATENKLWHKNVDILQSWDRCEKLVQEYTELCTTLQLIPVESEDEVDFAITIGTLQDPHISNDVEFLIQHLQPLMEDYRAIDKKTFEEGLAIKNSLTLLQEKQTELLHKVKQLEIEQERLGKLRVVNKTQLENDLNSYFEQIEAIQNEKESLESDALRLQCMSTQNLQKEQVEFEQIRIQLETRHNEYGQNLLNKLELVVEMKTRIQNQLEDFKQQLCVVFDNIVIS